MAVCVFEAAEASAESVTHLLSSPFDVKRTCFGTLLRDRQTILLQKRSHGGEIGWISFEGLRGLLPRDRAKRTGQQLFLQFLAITWAFSPAKNDRRVDLFTRLRRGQPAVGGAEFWRAAR